MVKRDLPHKGVTLTEVVVIFAIAALFILLAMLALPRMREGSRSTQCEKNLMTLGMGLTYYCQATGLLPTLPAPDVENSDPTSSAVGAILSTLQIEDLGELSPKGSPYVAGKKSDPRVKPMGLLMCSSDSNAFDAGHPAPISYRAVTGDTAKGTGGVFAPGKIVSVAAIEAGDGLSYTVAFTERLVGSGSIPIRSLGNYVVVPETLFERESCPDSSQEKLLDAGGRWAGSSWSQSLINHAIKPNQPVSCVAADSKTGLLSASSGHSGRVASLLMDGSVRQTNLTVALSIWKNLASIENSDGSY